MMLISPFTIALSAGYGVLMNLATNVLPVDFSVALCTTPKAPLKDNDVYHLLKRSLLMY